MSERQSQWTDQLSAIADLMLGVAHADGHFDPQEEAQIREGLDLFGRIDGLSEVVEARMRTFELEGFDLEAAVKAIRFHGTSDRRVLLELVRDVLDADEIRDHRETSYFFAVAEALGMADVADELLAPPEDSRPLIPGDHYD